MEFLTTSEAADYLRLGERKLYELVTLGAIPCSKVTGKWLFPRHELDQWVMSSMARPAGMQPVEPPPIVGGSQDDLLEWALRESGSALASLNEGTTRGVERLQRGEVIAAAVHFHSIHEFGDGSGKTVGDVNIAAVRALPGLHDALLIGLPRREQGLLVPPGNPRNLQSIADVLRAGATMAMHHPGAGAQLLLEALLARTGATLKDLQRLDPPRQGGLDLTAAIRNGAADCGIGTRAAAKAAGLDFVALTWENFDLLTRQRSYFRPAMQALVRFLGDGRLSQRAEELTGYDPSTAGQIRFAA
jgi:excisionase family DNA binding protein